jgi:signal transduction histidine kinase
MQRAAAPSDALYAKLDGAMRQTTRLERLIDNLLDVSRITTGFLDIHPETIDVVPIVREVVERFAVDAERAKVTVELELPPNLEARWDRTRIEQVLTNLLSNALRFRERGPVRVRLEASAGSAILEVEGGSPIPKANLPQLFERFGRPQSMRSHGGLGVGLFVTRQIVEAHGGAIRVTSPPDVPPIFTVTLPLNTRVNAGGTSKAEEEQSGGVA